MFSLDFSLFYDNITIIILMFIFYLAFQKSILPLILTIFKSSTLVTLIAQKELKSYNYVSRTLMSLQFFTTYRDLSNTFFLSECKPSILNYSYVRNA